MIWQPGEPAVVRYFRRGRLWSAYAVTIVVDSSDLIAYHLAAGMPRKVPRCTDGTNSRDLFLTEDAYEFADATWRDNDTLWLATPGDAHATVLFWPRGEERLLCWYVNLQEPLRRTPIGFDTSDQLLDVVVTPDLSSWRWKDEDEFELAQSRGLMAPDEARRIRAEGERVIEKVHLRLPPFGDGWARWRPDPTWPMPTFPTGWDLI